MGGGNSADLSVKKICFADSADTYFPLWAIVSQQYGKSAAHFFLHWEIKYLKA